jgi:hypothetical protein
MSFISKILGYRDFSKKDDIIEELKKYRFEDFGGNESFDNVRYLIFFKTKRQQTWLFASSENLYCVLDDISLDTIEVKWNIGKYNMVFEDKFILKVNINHNHSEKSGKIDFGDHHKGWLYSKELFQNPIALQESIINLVMSVMS